MSYNNISSNGLLLDSNIRSICFFLCVLCCLPLSCFSFFKLYDILLFIVFFCIIPFIIFYSHKIIVTWEHIAFIFLSLWTIFSYLESTMQSGFSISWHMYIMPCILFFVLTQIMHKDYKNILDTGISIIGFLISIQLIISLFLLYLRLGTHFDLHLNANIYWARSNYISSMIELPLLWFYDKLENKDPKKIYLFLFSLCFSAIILTASRGGILTIVISIILYNFLNKKGLSKPFILIIITSVFFILFSHSLHKRFTNIIDPSNINRVYLWLQSIELILKKPIMGYGAGNIALYGGIFDKYPKMPGPHNLILEVMLHIGIVGFLIYAIIFILIIRRSLYVYKTDKMPIYFVLIMASLFHSMVEPTFLGDQYNFIFWYFMSFLVIKSEDIKHRLSTTLPHTKSCQCITSKAVIP